MKKIVVAVTGPTASGKSAFAMELASFFKTEIISADSRQVFREMEIGTAKPTSLQLNRIRHHFINSHSITEPFNAGLYASQCKQILNTLFLQHDVVVIAGGSGLYLDAILKGMDELPEADEKTRNYLRREFEKQGITFLQNKLRELDPVTFLKTDTSNPQRMMRALEVSLVSGKPYSSFLTGKAHQPVFHVIRFLMDIPRQQLYQQIDSRVDEMIQSRLADEVKSLMPFKHHAAMQTVGYKELVAYFEGTVSLDEAILKIKQHTRNYAKRQITWFKKAHNNIPVSPDAIDFAVQLVQSDLNASA